MRKLFLYIIFCLCFGSCSAKEFPFVEERPCPYNPDINEHILNYKASGKVSSVCLEEELDLAEGEITGFKKDHDSAGSSFILFTREGWHYVLNLNSDGSLELHRVFN